MPEFKISKSRTELISELIDNLPSIRKRLRITQTELAGVIGKSRQTISDIERKASPMGWDTYLAILKALEVNGNLSDIFSKEYYEKVDDELKITR